MRRPRRLYVNAIAIICLAIAMLPLLPGRASAGGQLAQPGGARLYLPMVLRALDTSSENPAGDPGAPDLDISSLEITQAVQTDDNAVPLVASRPTVVRVYARTSQSTAQSGVVLSLNGTRNGIALPGSPLQLGPLPAPPNPSRGDYASSFNFTLPSTWLSGNVALVATVDPQNAVAEANEANNQASASLAFTAVPALNITIVPISYTHQPTGVVYAAPTQDRVSDWLRRAFPVSSVNVTVRAAVSFSGNLANGDDWSNLLDLVATLKSSDGAPSTRVYYALIPMSNGGASWITGSSFIAGIGFVGYRAAAGLDFGAAQTDRTGQIAGHEVGHNLGRLHAPCGATSGLDASYPYTGASIGPRTIGLDLSTSRIWSPNAPDSTKDLMGYCRPYWLSDYTYRGLFNALRADMSVQAAPSAGWLIRSLFDAQGAPALQPIYAVDAPIDPTPAQSEYAVALFDAAGALLGQYPVAVQELHNDVQRRSAHPLLAGQASADAVALRAIHAVIPQPAGDVARLQLLHNGAPIAERQLPARVAPKSADAPPALTLDGSQVLLRWGQDGTPALVRYSADGQSWATLAIDITAGELAIERTQLPASLKGTFEIWPAGAATPMRVAAQLAGG